MVRTKKTLELLGLTYHSYKRFTSAVKTAEGMQKLCSTILTSTLVFFCVQFYSTIHLLVSCYRQSISWHRPYCVDLGQSTFGMLKTFLEKNSLGMLNERLTSPFSDIRYCKLDDCTFVVIAKE